MTLQQLRSIQEVVRCGLNISAAARALNNTPPNVSRYIRMLEDELSVRMFQRAGGKLAGLTPEGAAIMDRVAAVLDSVDGVHRLAQGMQHAAEGMLTVGSADICATKVLPPVVAHFKQRHPGVAVNMLRGSLQEMLRLTAEGVTDFALVAGEPAQLDDLVALPYAKHALAIVLDAAHPLNQKTHLSLAELAHYPLATYVAGHAGRACVDEAFAAAGVVPDIAYAANDAELLKGMLRGGNAVGILCGASHDIADGTLRVRSGAQLFAPVEAWICLRRDSVMRRHGYSFIEMLAPHLSYDKVMRAISLRDPAEVAALLGQPPLVVSPAAPSVTPLPRAETVVVRDDGCFVRRSVASY